MVGKIVFGTFEEPVKENPYTEVVAQMVKDGENSSVTLILEKSEVTKERLKLSKAANDIDKTARLRHTDDSALKDGVGLVKLTFTLSPRHRKRRGKSVEEAATDV